MSTAMAVTSPGRRQRPAGWLGTGHHPLHRTAAPAGAQPGEERLEQLLAAALDNRGEDVAFLEKWGYDTEQKQAIGDSIYAVAEG